MRTFFNFENNLLIIEPETYAEVRLFEEKILPNKIQISSFRDKNTNEFMFLCLECQKPDMVAETLTEEEIEEMYNEMVQS